MICIFSIPNATNQSPVLATDHPSERGDLTSLYSPSLYMHIREEKKSCLSCEQFKSTLGVLDSSDTQEPHHKMESFHQYGPKKRSLGNKR